MKRTNSNTDKLAAQETSNPFRSKIEKIQANDAHRKKQQTKSGLANQMQGDLFDVLKIKTPDGEKSLFPLSYESNISPVPNITIRSSLFGVVARGRRREIKNEVIDSQNGYAIYYTGSRLDQADKDVWMQVLRIWFSTPPGERVSCTRKGFLRAIGRSIGKANKTWLEESLDRMVNCKVILESDKRRYADNLLGWAVDEETNELVFRVNEPLAKFFKDDFTIINLEKRIALKHNQLAKWLFDYFSSHATPYPVSVRFILEKSGSESKNMFAFRYDLREALELLTQDDIGLLRSFTIENETDLVCVEKRPSASQSRHIIKKIKGINN